MVARDAPPIEHALHHLQALLPLRIPQAWVAVHLDSGKVPVGDQHFNQGSSAAHSDLVVAQIQTQEPAVVDERVAEAAMRWTRSEATSKGR